MPAEKSSLERTARNAESLRVFISRLTLTDFRNYCAATLSATADPVILVGENGAGKTNCLEAISLLTAGRGLRSVPFANLVRADGAGGWAVAATIVKGDQEMRIGTGIQPSAEGPINLKAPRMVKIDDVVAKGSGSLVHIPVLWLTPTMDGLFTGPASDRRRFLDRLAMSLEPTHAIAAAAFDRAMRQRNRALETSGSSKLLNAIEAQMADAATSIAAIRHRVVASLASEIVEDRDAKGETPFPWAGLALAGHLENRVNSEALDDLRLSYARILAENRNRDRAAGRTLIGPHRSDIEVRHGPKATPARLCSTGEQKALLIGLVLAHARLIKKTLGGQSPLILLDEIAAHLDRGRRQALFGSIAELRAQAWMTGTEADLFAPLREFCPAQFFLVSNGSFMPENDAKSASKH